MIHILSRILSSNQDGNVTFTVSGYQDSVGNAGVSGNKVIAVDTKSQQEHLVYLQVHFH